MILKVAAKIRLQDLMQDQRSKGLMDVLNEGAKTPNALFVGGCVRNAVCGQPIGDIDIATKLTPAEVMKRLKVAKIKVVPTGIDHGTVTAVVGGLGFEITTLRRDVETDGRRAVVAFTTDWAEDAQRRDFTMNTLLADSKGRVYDPTGQGLVDLKKGRVVFVGDPNQRIKEDYLRILRFFRFHAYYGKGKPDKAGLAACKKWAKGIKYLSRERVTQEISKILLADRADEVLSLMKDMKIASGLISSRFSASSLKSLIRLQNKFDSIDLVSRLYLLAPATRLEKFLVLSNKFKDRLALLESFSKDRVPARCSKTDYFLYKYGRVLSEYAVLLRAVLKGETVSLKDIEKLRSDPIPVFPVKAKDLMAIGFVPGPELGEALRALEKVWIKSGFKPIEAISRL